MNVQRRVEKRRRAMCSILVGSSFRPSDWVFSKGEVILFGPFFFKGHVQNKRLSLRLKVNNRVRLNACK